MIEDYDPASYQPLLMDWIAFPVFHPVHLYKGEWRVDAGPWIASLKRARELQPDAVRSAM